MVEAGTFKVSLLIGGSPVGSSPLKVIDDPILTNR